MSMHIQDMNQDRFPPELAVILMLLRPAGQEVSLPQNVDWLLFERAVVSHRVSLAIRPDHPVYASLPEPVRDWLKQRRRDDSQRILMNTASLCGAVRALRTEGIRTLALKGPALATLLSGNPNSRPSVDIDIAVPLRDMERAAGTLAHLGFTQRIEAPSGKKEARQWNLTRASDRVTIELHSWPLNPHMDPVAPWIGWDHATTLSIGGEQIETPAAPIAVVYAAQHGCRHRWFRLFWLLDIDQAMRSADIDWDAVLNSAAMAGCRRHVYLACALANRLLTSPLPAPLASDNRAVRQAWHMSNKLMPIYSRAFVSEREASYLMGLANSVLFEAALRGRFTDRVATISRYFAPTGDDRALFNLPVALEWLYPVLRVLRLMGRSISGRYQ